MDHNQTAINLCNHGVSQLEKGDPMSAFESLSKAANLVMMRIENHQHANSGANAFQFHWVDCSNTASRQKESTSPFLFLRALGISHSHPIKHLCPCGYAWVVWFNLALSCSLIGSKLGEKGKLFLEMAYDLYSKVQRRVDSEPISRHWQILAMAISNNQACIFYDFACYPQTMECLQRLALTLSSCQDNLAVEDRGDFCLNLQILGSQTVAAAA